MKKTIWTFGLISGVLSAGMMAATVPFTNNLNGHAGYIYGYTTIVLSFLLVYFGIRSYRDNVAGGVITFGRAFGVGISITLISCVCYVLAWEVIYFNFLHGFMDNYGAHALAQMKASGASAAAIQAQTAQIENFKRLYQNPFYNAAMTFIEPFPVGLVITLISAGMLRRRRLPGDEVAVPAGVETRAMSVPEAR